MGQKKTNTRNENLFELDDIGLAKEKEILRLLASGLRMQQVALQFRTYPKAIHRIRDKAIGNFYLYKEELPKEVQDYLKHWAFNHGRELVEVDPEDIKKNNLKKHKDDLAEAAYEVIRVLSKFEGKNDWDKDTEIHEIIFTENDHETAAVLESPIAMGLLAHIKSEIDELAPLTYWNELKLEDLTFNLRNQILTKASRRDFTWCEKCEVCNWLRQKK